jgi:hypothetical protein
MLTLTSLGGAGTVTGSKHLLSMTAERGCWWTAACFQGLKALRLEQLAARCLSRRKIHRRGGADARAPGSLRLRAATW